MAQAIRRGSFTPQPTRKQKSLDARIEAQDRLLSSTRTLRFIVQKLFQDTSLELSSSTKRRLKRCITLADKLDDMYSLPLNGANDAVLMPHLARSQRRVSRLIQRYSPLANLSLSTKGS